MLFEIQTDPAGILLCSIPRNKASQSSRHLLESSSRQLTRPQNRVGTHGSFTANHENFLADPP